MSASIGDIVIKPSKVIWAEKATFCTTVESDVAGSLDALYWELNGVAGAGFYVWYDIDNGSVDPAPAGRTGVEVDVATAASAATVATSVAAAIDLLAGFSAHVSPKSSNVVVIRTATYEDAAIPAAGTTTGHVFEKVYSGFEYNLGETEGDLEFSFDQTLTDIVSQQGGATPIAAVKAGTSVELPVTFLETNGSLFDRLIAEASGGKETVGAEELIGFGSGNEFINVLDKSHRLILHPVSVDDSDKSEDFFVTRSYPLPGTITISGENPRTFAATFRGFKDEFLSENPNIDRWGKGDHTLV